MFCVFLLGSQRDHYGFRPRVSLYLSIYLSTVRVGWRVWAASRAERRRSDFTCADVAHGARRCTRAVELCSLPSSLLRF